MSRIILAAALLLCVAACAPRHQSDDWGALSRQVGRQLNK
jgi:hypothetical protein